MRTAPSWVITQRVVGISHRRFGTTCLPHLPDSRYWTETSVRYNHYSLRNNHRIAQFLSGTKHKIQSSNFSVAMSLFTDLFLCVMTDTSKRRRNRYQSSRAECCVRPLRNGLNDPGSISNWPPTYTMALRRNQLPVHLEMTTHLHELLRLFRG
jgi:hypothetical protein